MAVTALAGRIVRQAFATVVLAAATLPALAGPFDDCPTFTSCTAGVRGYVNANTSYIFSAVAPGYVLPGGFVVGTNAITDQRESQTAAPLIGQVGEIVCVLTCGSHFFEGFARAATQTDFGVNRALGRTSYGTSGVDVQGGGVSAAVRLVNFAEALSTWRDVWRFSTDGHAHAIVSIDGLSGLEGDNAHFPTGFTHGAITATGNWQYDLDVWDLGDLSLDEEGNQVPNRVGGASAVRAFGAPFVVDLTLDFDFLAGESYLVTSRLDVQVRDGAYVDLYNTALLGNLALSGGAGLTALSGHDYLGVAAAVPEPEVWASLLAGVFAVLGVGRRRTRARSERR